MRLNYNCILDVLWFAFEKCFIEFTSSFRIHSATSSKLVPCSKPILYKSKTRSFWTSTFSCFRSFAFFTFFTLSHDNWLLKINSIFNLKINKNMTFKYDHTTEQWGSGLSNLHLSMGKPSCPFVWQESHMTFAVSCNGHVCHGLLSSSTLFE